MRSTTAGAQNQIRIRQNNLKKKKNRDSLTTTNPVNRICPGALIREPLVDDISTPCAFYYPRSRSTFSTLHGSGRFESRKGTIRSSVRYVAVFTTAKRIRTLYSWARFEFSFRVHGRKSIMKNTSRDRITRVSIFRRRVNNNIVVR